MERMQGKVDGAEDKERSAAARSLGRVGAFNKAATADANCSTTMMAPGADARAQPEVPSAPS